MISQAVRSDHPFSRLTPLTYLLPAGLSWPLVLSGVAGFALLSGEALRGRALKKILLVLAGPCMYWMI